MTIHDLPDEMQRTICIAAYKTKGGCQGALLEILASYGYDCAAQYQCDCPFHTGKPGVCLEREIYKVAAAILMEKFPSDLMELVI